MSWYNFYVFVIFEFQRICIHQLMSCFSFGNTIIICSNVAAAAKSLQSCATLCNPMDSSPAGSPVPGILQARTLSGLPFPSAMHESEKWKWSRSVVSDSSRPHGLLPTWLLCPWDFPGKSTGVGCHCLLPCSCLGSTKSMNHDICSSWVKQPSTKAWAGFMSFPKSHKHCPSTLISSKQLLELLERLSPQLNFSGWFQ